MKRFRYYLFLLLLGLALFFNIERIDLLGQQNVLDIQSFVYTLTIAAVFSVVLLPIFSRSTPLLPVAFWFVVYIILKVLFFNLFADQNPLFGGPFTYVTITETAFLGILLLYTHRLINSITAFEVDIQKLFLRNGVQQVEEARETINMEVTRSRHYHRPMSVIVVEPETDSFKASFSEAVQEIQQAMSARYALNKVARTMRQQLRVMDTMLQEKNGRFIILCPEIDSDESELLAKRIQTAVSQQHQLNLRCATAAFPHEAPTFDGLLTQASAKIEHSQDRNPSQDTYQPVQHVYRSQQHVS